MTTPACQPMIAPSGEAVIFKLYDADLNPAMADSWDQHGTSWVTGLVDNNERLSVTLMARPTGGTFTLGFGGQTTAPISTSQAPPTLYCTWNLTGLTPGAPLDLAACLRVGQSGTTHQYFEVFDSDGAALLGTVTLNNQTNSGTPANPAPFQDAGVMAGAYGLVNWYTLGRFAPTGTSLHVRTSCDPAPVTGLNLTAVGDLRYAPPSGTPIHYLQPDETSGALTIVLPGVAYGGPGRGLQFYQIAADTHGAIDAPGQGAGPRTLADPAEVQAKLSALSSIGPGNVSVTGDGSPTNPLMVRFVGTLGGALQPLLAAPDPAVKVLEVARGGTLPVLTVPRLGAPIPLPHDWFYWNATPGHQVMPTVAVHFPQAPPDLTDLVVQRSANRYAESTIQGGWTTGIGGGLTGQSLQSTAATATAAYKFEPLGPGTFRLSASWPHDPSFADSVTYTVRTAIDLVVPRVTADGSGTAQFRDQGIRAISRPCVLSATCDGGDRAGSVIVYGVDQSGALVSETLPPFNPAVGTWTVTGSVVFRAVIAASMPAQVVGALTRVNTTPITLAAVTVDQTVAPSGVTDRGVAWQVLGSWTLTGVNDGLIVTQSNGTTTRMVTDAVRLERTSPDASIRLTASDVATLAWGAGWAGCGAGPLPAATAVSALNLVGGRVYPPLPTSTTMGVGFNMNFIGPGVCNYNYMNLVNIAGGIDRYPGLGQAYGPTVPVGITEGHLGRGGENKLVPSVPDGDYLLMWDSPSMSACLPVAASGAITVTASDPPRTVDNKVWFTAAGDAFGYGAVFNVQFHSYAGSGGLYDYDISNLRIYPADVDLANPPLYRPNVLARNAHMASTRNLNLTGFNANPTEFLDYNRDPALPSRAFAARPPIRVPIAAITDPASSPLHFYRPNALPLLITSPGHGFSQDQMAFIQGYDDAHYPVMIRDSAGDTKQWYINGWDSPVYPVDADHFILQIGGFPHGDYAMIGTLTDPSPGSYIEMTPQAVRIDDLVRWSNDTMTDCYWPTSLAYSDDCMTRIGDYAGRVLAAGLRFRVECTNETWNWSGPHGGYALCATGTFAFGLGTLPTPDDDVPYLCQRADYQWTRMRNAWVAAGRDPADFVRVMASQQTVPDKSRYRAEYCHIHGIGFDELVVGSYLSNAPSFMSGPADEYAFEAVIDRMTVAQHLDMLELHYCFGGYESQFPNLRRQINGQATSPTGAVQWPEFDSIPMGVYEGGPDVLFVSGGTRRNMAYIAKATTRHPRVYGWYQHLLRVLQDSGCALFHDFDLGSYDSFGDSAWNCYVGTGQLPYVPGDPAQDDIQINQPTRLDLVQSVPGGALLAFAALRNVVVTPDFTLSSAPVSVARGQAVPLTATMHPAGGYAGHATLATTGLPPGVTAGAWVPAGLDGTGTRAATQLLTASSTAAAGVATLTVTATDAAASLTHTAAAALTVTVPTIPPPAGSTARARRYIPSGRTRLGA